MSKPQKIITIALWIIAVVAMVGVLALKTLPPGRDSVASQTGDIAANERSNEPAVVASAKDLAVLYDVPKFELVDQNGKKFTNNDLAGHPFIADFIFTTCATICPQMSTHMAEMQKQLPADVKLVSFTVDPEHDTPMILLAYAGRYQADLDHWTFVTGDPKVATAFVKGMKIGVLPAQGNDPMMHDTHYVLADSQGRVRGVYDSNSPSRISDLVHDAKLLAGEVQTVK
jgi:protein SCO1/2